jgi:hypothetical protein
MKGPAGMTGRGRDGGTKSSSGARLLLVLGVLLAPGCRPQRPNAPTPESPNAPTSNTAKTPTPNAQRPTPNAHPREKPEAGREITPEHAGPLRVGMKAEDAQRLPNLTVGRTERTVRGTKRPTLTVNQFGEAVAMAELAGDQVDRIIVVGPDYLTPEGVGVGDTAKELNGIYGAGKMLQGDTTPCARFEKAPGLTFCFQPSKDFLDGSKLTWSQALKKNPRIVGIIVDHP